MSDTVGGYNLSRGKGVHQIHVRLRRPSSHELLSYEEVAGVLIHEMAHCEIGPHSVEFYELMQVIEEQYHTNMVNGVVASAVDNRALFAGTGHTLGTTGASKHAPLVDELGQRKKVAEAAERRRQYTGIAQSGGVALGGSDVARTKKLSPKEAARIAAERRFRDSQWCLPCHEVIQILDQSDDEETGNHDRKLPAIEDIANIEKTRARKGGLSKDDGISVDTKVPAREKRRKEASDRSSQSPSFVDLTIENDSDSTDRKSDVQATPQFPAWNASTASASSSSSLKTSPQQWACQSCTFLNSSHLLFCEVCGNPHVAEDKNHELIVKMLQKEEIDRQKKDEYKRSEVQFGGFNIYGARRKNTSTMNHLT